jgi:predicted nucleic acid-binding protein
VILADSSAWIEYDRATGSDVHIRVRELIDAEERSGPLLAITDPVVAEVTMGARTDAQELALRRLLARFAFLPFDAGHDFDGAVRVYRRCRQQGVTPRGLVDCMVAAVAMRHGAALLAADADINRIAEVMDLRLDAY